VTAFAVAFSLLAGLAGGMQVAVMARLGERIGSLEALAFATVVTMVIAAAVLLVARQSWSGYAAAVRQPVWLWSGGAFGALIVLAITYGGARLGTTGTVALLISGNLVAAVTIDRLGWFGIDRIGLHWYRVLGLILLGAGAALALKK
jgi:bacterial/archaeal transporter family-2 protein